MKKFQIKFKRSITLLVGAVLTFLLFGRANAQPIQINVSTVATPSAVFGSEGGQIVLNDTPDPQTVTISETGTDVLLINLGIQSNSVIPEFIFSGAYSINLTFESPDPNLPESATVTISGMLSGSFSSFSSSVENTFDSLPGPVTIGCYIISFTQLQYRPPSPLFPGSLGISMIVQPNDRTIGSVSGLMRLEGCLSHAKPLTFTFRSSTCLSFSRTVLPQANGDFTIMDLPERNYTVHIKGAKWLAKNLNVNLTNGNVSGVNVTLPAGDANNDNRVNVLDLDVLIEAFDSVSGSPNWNEKADFNGDNAVNVLDLDLLIRNFDRQGDA